jgi:hypothetical protein
MVVLDVSIVTVALPSIGRDLHYSATGTAVGGQRLRAHLRRLPAAGRARRDLFGRRRVYLFRDGAVHRGQPGRRARHRRGLADRARAVQGVAGAVPVPGDAHDHRHDFPADRRARALGIWSAVAGGGGAAGSILGGILTSALSWRWVLFVNIPIGVAAMAAALAWLPRAARAGRRGAAARLDVAGPSPSPPGWAR